eukprot:scaffold11167_cov21-Tisochrysis_lutea.AAC.3
MGAVPVRRAKRVCDVGAGHVVKGALGERVQCLNQHRAQDLTCHHLEGTINSDARTLCQQDAVSGYEVVMHGALELEGTHHAPATRVTAENRPRLRISPELLAEAGVRGALLLVALARVDCWFSLGNAPRIEPCIRILELLIASQCAHLRACVNACECTRTRAFRASCLAFWLQTARATYLEVSGLCLDPGCYLHGELALESGGILKTKYDMKN